MQYNDITEAINNKSHLKFLIEDFNIHVKMRKNPKKLIRNRGYGKRIGRG